MPPIRRGRSNFGRGTRNATSQQAKLIFSLIGLHNNVKIEMKLKGLGYHKPVQRVVHLPSLNRAAFSYDVSIDYSAYQCVAIGTMNSVSQNCKALKYKNEAAGLCCANGKVKLVPLIPPPDPSYSLVSGTGTDSIHFLTNIQNFKNCFQIRPNHARSAEQNRFGGAMILLAGDFRQTLPVIPRSTPADELNACLKSSVLWKHVKILNLSQNMRVELQNDRSGERISKQLIDMGNGKLPSDVRTGCITFPDNFCQFTESKTELIQEVFPNVAQNNRDHIWLSERAILAAKNVDVNELNFQIQNEIAGELRTYKSVDSVTNRDDVVNYPPEFLNSLDLPGLPPHILQLKVVSVVIMLRNINQPRLCNGTRLAVKTLLNNVIEATILTGKYKGEDVLIPRIPMIPTDIPFEFKRLQFPVRLAFAMTINKSQGQSLSVCSINPVGKQSTLLVYAPGNQTKNIVYLKALQ